MPLRRRSDTLLRFLSHGARMDAGVRVCCKASGSADLTHLHDVWMYEASMVEDLALHIARHLRHSYGDHSLPEEEAVGTLSSNANHMAAICGELSDLDRQSTFSPRSMNLMATCCAVCRS